jgi:hypothetical protein
MFSEANGSRSTLALEKKEGTLDTEEMEMTEKGMKQKVFFVKIIINIFFFGGGGGWRVCDRVVT